MSTKTRFPIKPQTTSPSKTKLPSPNSKISNTYNMTSNKKTVTKKESVKPLINRTTDNNKDEKLANEIHNTKTYIIEAEDKDTFALTDDNTSNTIHDSHNIIENTLTDSLTSNLNNETVINSCIDINNTILEISNELVNADKDYSNTDTTIDTTTDATASKDSYKNNSKQEIDNTKSANNISKLNTTIINNSYNDDTTLDTLSINKVVENNNTEKLDTFSSSFNSKVTDNNKTEITFCTMGSKYSFLSNFYSSQFTIDNVTYFHVEGYYQSQKFVYQNVKAAKHIASIMSPMLCKRASRNYYLAPDKKREWESGRRDMVMLRALYSKFTSSSELLAKLLDTKESILIEYSSSDKYWGQDANKQGNNQLGKLLMQVRASLKYCI